MFCSFRKLLPTIGAFLPESVSRGRPAETSRWTDSCGRLSASSDAVWLAGKPAAAATTTTTTTRVRR